jgi:GrpB-like predicted nucleotidyltransferase (UPF0157 family)
MARLIEIVDYKSCWPAQFREIADRVRWAMGDEAIRIDHIGSTAVTDLAAKDIIDIQITIERFDDTGHRAALESIGLEWRPLVVSDHCPPGASLGAAELEKRFATGAIPMRTNVHLRVADRFNQRYPLLCRDYLRAHPSAAAAYAAVKRALARRLPDDVASYYDVKDPVFDLIMTGAHAWADATDWEPPRSDA